MPRKNPLQPDPEALPPTGVRILELRVEPWPDGRRVRVHVALTPFQQRPNLSACIVSPSGEEIAAVEIIESMDDRFVFTMHLRGDPAETHFNLTLSVHYPDLNQVDRRSLDFEVTPGAE